MLFWSITSHWLLPSPRSSGTDAEHGSTLVEGTSSTSRISATANAGWTGTSSRQPKILCLASAYSSSLCFKDFTSTRFWLELSSEGEASAVRTPGRFNIVTNCSCSSPASPSSSVDLNCILLDASSGTVTASGRFKIVTLTSDWFSSSTDPSWYFRIGSGSRGGRKFSRGGGTVRFKFFRETAKSPTMGLGNWRGAFCDCSLGCATVKTGRSATACQTHIQEDRL